MKLASNFVRIEGETAFVDVSTPKFPDTWAIIDVVDLTRVIDGQGRWYPFQTPRSHTPYIMRKPSPRLVRGAQWLHRVIVDAPPELVVDHANRNGLDNRRVNLRTTTAYKNSANARHGRGASRFKGVSRKRDHWKAEIRADGIPYWLGSYLSETEAARAYDTAAIALHGPFALTNFGDNHVYV